jgi:hypothetical protein
MKVYGWTAILRRAERDALGLPHHRIQARCIIAAPSMAAIGRILGVRPGSLFNLCETGNDEEIRVASAKPGTFFAATLDGRRDEWIEVAPEAVR